jgi:hypothetical protein
MLQLPVSTGDPADSQAEGVVVDRDLGWLYVGVEHEVGVLEFPAEPGAGNSPLVVHPINSEFFKPDIEGLTIYYGTAGTGYLLVSSQGDNTYAVFDRRGNNAYLGSFTVGEKGNVDPANESDGADVLNLSLGPFFPFGLIVVQDGANDPLVLAEDDGELENISTNFKFVPWQNVARTLQLQVDPRSFNPRGTVLQQIDSLKRDVDVFVSRSELLTIADAEPLLDQLQRAHRSIQAGAQSQAFASLTRFVSEALQLRFSGRLGAGQLGQLMTYTLSLQILLAG